MQKQKEIECTIIGLVQLVMFRDFAQRKARFLKLVGWVRNNNDGSVTVVAEGDEPDLLNYIEILKKGPTFSRVENIEVVWQDARAIYSDFIIHYQ